MASGLLGFLGFGKKSKPNLTPSVDYPNQGQLDFMSADASKGGYSLRDFAKRRIRGEDTGFGDDFTNRMSSPGIAQIDANFKNRTLPTLSSEASKRGLSRSSIVQDQIGQADQARNRDIASMVANFQYLNEQQKKTDQMQGVNLGERLDQEQLGMLNNQAAQAERQVGRNTDYANQQNAADRARQNQTLQAMGSLISPVLGKAFTPQEAPISPTSAFMGGSSGVQTQLLGSLSPQHLDAMSIEELLKLFGG